MARDTVLSKYSVISVRNWKKYQGKGQVEGQAKGQQMDSKWTQTRMYKNKERVFNEGRGKEYTDPTLGEIEKEQRRQLEILGEEKT